MSFALVKLLLFGLARMKYKSRKGSGTRVVPENEYELGELPSSATRSMETDRTVMKPEDVDLERQDNGYDEQADKEPSKNIFIKFCKNLFSRFPGIVGDSILGLSDGLTVPFALTAGLSSVGNTHLVIVAGLAELVAGAISMGLGGFLAAKSDMEAYHAKVASTRKWMETSPSQTNLVVTRFFRKYRFTSAAIVKASKELHDKPDDLLEFLMRSYHEVPEPEHSRPWVSAFTIGISYFLGGFIPLVPYLCIKTEMSKALYWSIGTMAITLFVFGWVKTCINCGWRGRKNIRAGIKGAIWMTFMGGFAAAAAYGLVRAMNRHHND